MLNEIHSGSSGNCSFLIYPEQRQIILFDLGLSFKKINDYFIENMDMNLRDCDYKLFICISHSHSDHWKQATYRAMLKQFPKLVILFPRLYDGTSMWVDGHFESTWLEHSVHAYPLKHGDTETFFYIIDGKFGYLTDVESSQIMNILTIGEAYNLEDLFLESNYDESWTKYKEQADIANGYSVDRGFSRHLSKTEHDYIVSALQPQHEHSIHHSSRFYQEMQE